MQPREPADRPSDDPIAWLAAPRARALALVLVLLVGAGIRIVFRVQLERTTDFARLAVDADGYDLQARGILAGSWPGDAVYYQDALYPWFLAAHYRLVGDEPARVFTTQALLGLLSAALAFVLASLVLGPLEGILAGLLTATFGVFLFYEALLLKAALSIALLLAFLVTVVIARRRESLLLALASGVLLGLACLLRGNLLALVPIVLAWLAWPRPGIGLRKRVLSASTLLVGAALGIAPVTIHNVRAGEFVLITSQAGQNFYIGNNPGNDTGGYVPPAGVRGVQAYEQIDFARLAENEVGHTLTVRERSSYWFEKAFEFFRDEPRAALALQWKKLLLFTNAVEVPDNADYATTRGEVPLLRLPLPSFALLFVLACASLVLVRWTSELRVLLAVGLTISATVIAFYVFSRYRLPVVPLLIVFAAAVPRALAQRIAGRDWLRLGLALVVAGVAAWLTARDAWSGNRSMLHYNRALFALEDEDPGAALERLEDALEIDPANWYALMLRGQLRAEAGDPVRAVEDLEAACAVAPGAAEPRYKLGLLFEETRDLDRARGAYLAALRAEPLYDVAAVRLADVERQTGNLEEARRLLVGLVGRRARFFPALALLGRLELEAGRPVAALPWLERASELRPEDSQVRANLARARRLAGD